MAIQYAFLGGLSEHEVAQALCLSERTIRRGWEKAKLLLRAALDQTAGR
ncbi:MAG: hypothetical protein K2X12_21420 [Burkholderiaceae bacterium]|nr:hypothetical protein [Burkholderiaceae bacterium]